MMQSFSMPIRIYYEDTDAGGVVYHANYLKFLERARTEWLRECGVEQDLLLKEGIVFVVARANCNFLKSIRFNQKINVVTTIEKISKTSIICAQKVVDEVTPELVYFQADVKIGCVELASFKVRKIPESIKRQICAE